MGVKDMVNKVLGEPDLWPPAEDVADLTAASEHAVRALKHAREEVPRCDDIQHAERRRNYFAARFYALETRRRQATTRAEADALLPIMHLIDLCFDGWVRQFDFLYREALQRGHGRNHAFAHAEFQRRARSLYPSSPGGEAA